MAEQKSQNITTITNAEHLNELIQKGYTLIGPRKDSEKDAASIARFFDRGYEFFPEPLLIEAGFDIVPPSTFTKGLQFAYSTKDDVLEKYYKSQYSLTMEGEEIPLYLKYLDKD